MVESVVCAFCSAPFVSKGSSYHAKFCSKRCTSLARRIAEKRCGHCRVTFRPAKTQTVYCGRACMYAAVAKQRRGAGNPGWKGGIAYTREYHAVITPRLRKGARCVVCSTRARLVVHHRNRRRGDNRTENLAVVCRPCHNRHHALEWWAEKKKRRYVPPSGLSLLPRRRRRVA